MRNLWAFLLLCAPGQALAQPALPTTSAGYTARIYFADATLLGPGGLAIDANRVVVVDPRGSGPSGDLLYSITRAGVLSTFATPAGAAFCPNAQVAISGFSLDTYVFDTQTNQLIIIDSGGAVTARSIGLSGGSNCTDGAIIGLATHQGQNFALYGASPADGRVYFINPTTGATQIVAQNLGQPSAIAVNIANNDVVVLDGQSGNVWRIPVLNPTPVALTLNPPTPLSSIAISPAGQLFGLTSGGRIVAVAQNGDVRTFVCGLENAGQIAFGRATGRGGNNLFVTQLGATATANDGDAIFEIDGAFAAFAVGDAQCAPVPDAGVVDAAAPPPPDAGGAADAGAPPDGAEPTDSGAVADGGGADAAGSEDALPPDVQVVGGDSEPAPDLGAPVDSGAGRPDAGLISGADAEESRDAGTGKESSGCSCESSSAPISGAAWALAIFGLSLVLRRRR
jgi:MYXO-CTERM domain-containing protein